jgi:hypothetical protein
MSEGDGPPVLLACRTSAHPPAWVVALARALLGAAWEIWRE